MKTRALLLSLLLGLPSASTRGAEYLLDDVHDALAFRALGGQLNLQLGGTLDLEAYAAPHPPPGLLYDDGNVLIQPRFTFDIDAQLGDSLYAFAQFRADRGFDPGDGGARLRADEYALRISPREDGALNFQAGKFSTVTGNWIQRHRSWENPFITAPLPYENPTGIWNIKPAPDSLTLLKWAHVDPALFVGEEFAEKTNRTPVVWGPVYATGASVFGRIGRFDYAAEIKNAGVSSHPDTWAPSGSNPWRHPAFAGRLGYRPDARWNLGVSASSGPYLQPEAAPLLPPGRDLGDYRQILLAHDASFAWRRLQLWAEVYAARFEIPEVTHAETLAAYIEAKYKLTPRLYVAARVNRQIFGTIPDGLGGSRRWGRDTWRLDFATGLRPTPHTQVKLQYSFQDERDAPDPVTHTGAIQFTVRF